MSGDGWKNLLSRSEIREMDGTQDYETTLMYTALHDSSGKMIDAITLSSSASFVAPSVQFNCSSVALRTAPSLDRKLGLTSI
jgi:hypothetical protein